jgi:serine/threonine-protein kinase
VRFDSLDVRAARALAGHAALALEPRACAESSTGSRPSCRRRRCASDPSWEELVSHHAGGAMNDGARETKTHVDSSLRLSVGAQLAGRYRIDGFVGIGGMGVVYRARREARLDVALKLLRPELAAEPEQVERLRREVVLARQVSHRGVVRSTTSVRTPSSSSHQWTLVDGRSLRRLIEQEAPLAPERAEKLLRQLAEALAARTPKASSIAT